MKREIQSRSEARSVSRSAPRSALVAIATCCTLGVLSGAAAAAAPADEGSYDGLTCYVGQANPLTGVEGHVGASYETVGTAIRSPGQLGFGASIRCIGAFVASAGETENRGACVMADPDGDRVFMVFSRGGNGQGQWKATGGTGKYQRIQAAGTYEDAHRPKVPAVAGRTQFCNREVGRWKLK